ncbi:MAG: hypothetical protein WC755_01920 [Candidatus Woesearchaeota archaeon]
MSKIYNDKTLAKHNIRRYSKLKRQIIKIKRILFSTQSGALQLIKDLLEERLVKANKDILKKVKFLLSGENNQLVPMDSPHRAKQVLDEIVTLIDICIEKEIKRARGKENEWIV